MRTIRGQDKRVRAAALFTDQEVRAIRRADEVGLVSRKDQARLYGVGKATIDRICRGDTYFWVAQVDEGLDDRGPEPTEEEIKASQAKLFAMLREQGQTAGLVGELVQGEDWRVGLDERQVGLVEAQLGFGVGLDVALKTVKGEQGG